MMFLLVAESQDVEQPIHLVYDSYLKAAQLSEQMQKCVNEIEFIGSVTIYRLIPMDWQSLFTEDPETIESYGENLIEYQGKYYRLHRIESWHNIK